MRFLYDSRSLFVHIPRTGGTWVEKALSFLNMNQSKWVQQGRPTLPRKHILPILYGGHRLSGIEDMFCFVRHPIAYYESVWRYLNQRKEHRHGMLSDFTWHPFSGPTKVYSDDFQTWCNRMVEFYPGWYSHLIDLYVGPPGAEYVWRIGRTRRLVDDFCQILTELGYGKLVRENRDGIHQIGKQNASSGEVNWDNSTRKQILKNNRSVVERFYGENFNRIYYAP